MEAIVKLSSMGDIIHSLIVLPKLKNKIDFIVDDSFKEILEENPYINNIIPLKLREAKKNKSIFLKEFKKLSKIKYNIVYDLQGLIKSAIVSKMVSKESIGYKNPREKIASFFYSKKILSTKEYAIERYLELFEIEDKKYLIDHPKLLFYREKEFDFLSKNRKNIIFIIGASWKCKKTPISIWIEIAKYLKNENIIIPYIGEEEKKDALNIAKEVNNIQIVNLTLNELKALISKADLLIGNDTGPSFIAWANNINNLILYWCTYNNKILENRYSKSIEVQKSISKNRFFFDRVNIKEILKAIEDF